MNPCAHRQCPPLNQWGSFQPLSTPSTSRGRGVKKASRRCSHTARIYIAQLHSQRVSSDYCGARTVCGTGTRVLLSMLPPVSVRQALFETRALEQALKDSPPQPRPVTAPDPWSPKMLPLKTPNLTGPPASAGQSPCTPNVRMSHAALPPRRMSYAELPPRATTASTPELGARPRERSMALPGTTARFDWPVRVDHRRGFSGFTAPVVRVRTPSRPAGASAAASAAAGAQRQTKSSGSYL